MECVISKNRVAPAKSADAAKQKSKYHRCMLLEVYGHRRKSEFPIPFVIGIDFPVFIINKCLKTIKFLIVLPFEN